MRTIEITNDYPVSFDSVNRVSESPVGPVDWSVPRCRYKGHTYELGDEGVWLDVDTGEFVRLFVVNPEPVWYKYSGLVQVCWNVFVYFALFTAIVVIVILAELAKVEMAE